MWAKPERHAMLKVLGSRRPYWKSATATGALCIGIRARRVAHLRRPRRVRLEVVEPADSFRFCRAFTQRKPPTGRKRQEITGARTLPTPSRDFAGTGH